MRLKGRGDATPHAAPSMPSCAGPETKLIVVTQFWDLPDPCQLKVTNIHHSQIGMKPACSDHAARSVAQFSSPVENRETLFRAGRRRLSPPSSHSSARRSSRSRKAPASPSHHRSSSQSTSDSTSEHLRRGARDNGRFLSDLNTPLNRNGGNNTTRYNWQLNADTGTDGITRASPTAAPTAGERGDTLALRCVCQGNADDSAHRLGCEDCIWGGASWQDSQSRSMAQNGATGNGSPTPATACAPTASS